MFSNSRLSRAGILGALCVVVALAIVAAPAGSAVRKATMKPFATGLENPRGLHWGPDGRLYVAEGGTGGNMSTAGKCDYDPDQVPFPVGPYLGSSDGSRISVISPRGDRQDFVTGLPSSQTGPVVGNFTSGVADVAFVGRTLYALISGAGCSHGVLGIPNEIVRIDPDGTWTMIADLSAFWKAHPVANPEPDDFEPDGTPYSMVAVRGDLYVVEPNHGELDRVTTDGRVSRVVDYSAVFGHVVPTTVAYHGNFYIGNLGTLEDLGKHDQFIAKVTPSGQTHVVASGLQTVLGLVFDGRGRMYVLDMGGYVPGQGRVLRIDPSGRMTEIFSGLDHPTAITLGPDGALYVSDHGFGYCSFGACTGTGTGQIVRIAIP